MPRARSRHDKSGQTTIVVRTTKRTSVKVTLGRYRQGGAGLEIREDFSLCTDDFLSLAVAFLLFYMIILTTFSEFLPAAHYCYELVLRTHSFFLHFRTHTDNDCLSDVWLSKNM